MSDRLEYSYFKPVRRFLCSVLILSTKNPPISEDGNGMECKSTFISRAAVELLHLAVKFVNHGNQPVYIFKFSSFRFD